MDSQSNYKAKLRRIWAELLTIRQIAAQRLLWRAATLLAVKAAGGYGGLDDDPFVKAILASRKAEPDLHSRATDLDAVGGRLRPLRGIHPQRPQTAWHEQRQRRTRMVRRIRGPSHPERRRRWPMS